jgi:formylglycine-generating enzyme required for sulfatase activity
MTIFFNLHPFSLPSEAQWEYACRAGTNTPFHFGDTIVTEGANFNGSYFYGSASKGEYLEKITSVGFYKMANSFGLYDMHGNVWEWCEDTWHQNYKDDWWKGNCQRMPNDGSSWISRDKDSEDFRLLRGGSWFCNPSDCRSAHRLRWSANTRDSTVGFRLACTQEF